MNKKDRNVPDLETTNTLKDAGRYEQVRTPAQFISIHGPRAAPQIYMSTQTQYCTVIPGKSQNLRSETS